VGVFFPFFLDLFSPFVSSATNFTTLVVLREEEEEEEGKK